MRENVLRYIRERSLLRAGDRVAVAVSGGADSVALLRALLELRPALGIVLAVAHFNHGLRGEASDADAAFVAELAKQRELEFFAARGNVRTHASASKLSLEAAARQLRYRWFQQLAREQRLDAIATAHTLDDQAETVMLKFLRGAGTRGLAGIYPILNRENVRIVRPLLCVSRAEVEGYLAALGQEWREDESNRDRRFLRNRVRHELLPLLARDYNPNLNRALADLADLAQAEQQYWDDLVAPHRVTNPSGELLLTGFAALPVALQRRVLKHFAEAQGAALDFAHVERLRRCALGELTRAELPGDRIGVRVQGALQIRASQPPNLCPYEYVLPIPGEVYICERQATLRALIVAEEFAREAGPGALLQRDLLGEQLLIRNWREGDRFHPAHRGSEEKLKRLFAERRIPAAQRRSWPLALCRGEIVWVEGFPVAAAYEWKGHGEALKIDTAPREAAEGQPLMYK